ncbi:MAG: tRNA pseudouridine(55) synthase TruB [Planctomycetes bacterium]|nr:tRNA pseudouridine(55) synthase TruB [Planctomycetota bacterium]
MLDGILLIDKSPGLTSSNVCEQIAKLTRSKCGHGGTLDPLATGLLIVGIGKGVKILNMLSNFPKTYYFEAYFGKETDTLDSTGVTVKESHAGFTKKQLEDVIESFIGISDQTVPMYSAHRVNGERLYKLARSNIKVDVPIKRIKIQYIKLLSYALPCSSFEVQCSTGTYIRALARDIGYKLDTVSHVTKVRRIKIGEIDVTESFRVEDLSNVETIQNKLIPLDTVLSFLPMVELNESQYLRFVNGNFIQVSCDKEFSRVHYKGKFIAIAQKLDQTHIKPHKLLFK